MTDALLTLPEVMSKVKLSRATLYRWEKSGKFPSRRELAPDCVRWLESEITEWMHNLPRVSPNKLSRAGKKAA